jgi:hypothetical protein
MHTRSSKIVAGVAFLAVSLLPVSSACGQSAWLSPERGNHVAVEILKAKYSDIQDVSFSTSVWYLSGQWQVTPVVALVGELPFSRFDVKVSGYDAETMLGNPYVGAIFTPRRSPAVIELGMRIPALTEERFIDNPDAAVNGWYTDADRWEAFYPDLLPLRLRGGMDISTPGSAANVLTHFRIGPTLWIPTSSDYDTEVFIDGVAGVWFEPTIYQFGITFSSMTVLTESDLSFSERSEFQMGFAANATFGNLRPGVHMHLPLGNKGLLYTGELVDAVFGLNLTVLLPQAGVL